MTDEAFVDFFDRLAEAHPQPASELVFSSVFELLAAVLLSAQTTDAAVNRATRTLFAAAPTPQAMHALGVDGIAAHIRTLGLFRTKAAHLHRTCELLLAEHGGRVPMDRERLQTLPGVGRKTANVVLNVAAGLPTMAVDTHVFRVANRTGLARGATPLAVELGLLARLPPAHAVDAHHRLILHGRYVCTARAPRCGVCPVSMHCDFAAAAATTAEEAGPGGEEAAPAASTIADGDDDGLAR